MRRRRARDASLDRRILKTPRVLEVLCNLAFNHGHGRGFEYRFVPDDAGGEPRELGGGVGDEEEE